MPDGSDCSKRTKTVDLGLLSSTSKVVKFATGSDKLWTTLALHALGCTRDHFNHQVSTFYGAISTHGNRMFNRQYEAHVMTDIRKLSNELCGPSLNRYAELASDRGTRANFL